MFCLQIGVGKESDIFEVMDEEGNVSDVAYGTHHVSMLPVA
jgi:RIO-like serine/threonine protein kinase